MKRAVFLLVVFSVFGAISHAQSTRQLTRRIAPQVSPAPAPSPRAVPGPGPTPRAVPGGPTVPQPTAAQKAEADKKLLEFQISRAEKGSDNAQYELGMRYLVGKGVEKDEKKACEWLQKAAEGGNPLARKKVAELKAAGTFEIPEKADTVKKPEAPKESK